MKRVFSLMLCLTLLLFLVGCASKEVPEHKVSEEYLQHLAGKTFVADGSVMTFYKEGVATYDFSEHHYGYKVTVTESSDTQIILSLETTVVRSSDYIDRGPEEAIYNITDNTLRYYQTYTCLFDPGNSEHFSNTAGTYDTVCAQNDCRLLIALSGHTVYCPEHADRCEFCGDYVDPGKKYCPGCPACIECGTDIESGTGIYCASCKPKTPPSDLPSSSLEKCIVCNGTGYAKFYYGSSDLEAYLNGHDPYWFAKCPSCNGKGRD